MAPPISPTTRPDLARGPRLARNTLWNLLGTALPVAGAMVILPWMLRVLGDERYGVLSQVLLVVGQAAIFDLGTGLALTKLLAEQPADGPQERSAALIGSALTVMTLLGLVAAGLLAGLGPWLVTVLRIPPAFADDALLAFRLAALGLPLALVGAGTRSILEARQRFGWSNAVRLGAAALTLGGQVLLLRWAPGVLPLVALTVAVVAVAALAQGAICWRVLPELRRGFRPRLAAVPALFRLGGWLTVVILIGNAMLYLDRYWISGLVGLGEVAAYAVPFDVVTKLWLLPLALAGVLLPAISAASAHDPHRATLLFVKAVKHVALGLFPLALAVAALAPEALRLWLGTRQDPAFIAHAGLVAQVLAAGVFASSLCVLPLTLLQAVGRPELSALVYVLELPVYVLATPWVIRHYGVAGAAGAWSLRLTAEALLMLFLARRALRLERGALARAGVALVGGVVVLLVAAGLPGVRWRGAWCAGVLLAFVPLAWRVGLDAAERARVRAWLARPRA